MDLRITIGYPMSKEECKDILHNLGKRIEDFESEREAYEEAAINKFNVGYGCEVEFYE